MRPDNRDVQGSALEYLRHGWSPIPIPFGQKGPNYKNWQQSRLTEADITSAFAGQDNIGVLLGDASGGLVDVDLDCPQTIELADTFLPATDAIFGRPSKPASHLLYVAEPIVGTAKFRDVDGTMLVELRSSGCQTVFPPSQHSNEVVNWYRAGDPARIASDELKKQVARLAAAALIARHWPERGSRQEAALALAGGLLRDGWERQDVAGFISAVAVAAGDAETKKRSEVAESTDRRLAGNGTVTGWARLGELIGQQVMKRARNWLGINTVDRYTLATDGEVTKRSELKPSLSGHIDRIRRDGKLLAFEKKREIAEVVLSTFSAQGRFYTTSEQRPFYFLASEHRLYRVDSDRFLRLLADATGLNPTEVEFKYLVEAIMTHVLRRGTEVKVYQFGHFDKTARRLYVSDLSGGIFIIDEQKITHEPNGTNGILFEDFGLPDPIRYIPPDERTGSLDALLNEINFESRGQLIHRLSQSWRSAAVEIGPSAVHRGNRVGPHRQTRGGESRLAAA